MRERGAGTIVNITSVAGRIGAVAQAPYVASKWAFEGLSEQLAQEVAPFGVRVAIIEPGVTKSSIFGKNIDTPNDDRRLRRALRAHVPDVRRRVRPRHRRDRGGAGRPRGDRDRIAAAAIPGELGWPRARRGSGADDRRGVDRTRSAGAVGRVHRGVRGRVRPRSATRSSRSPATGHPSPIAVSDGGTRGFRLRPGLSDRGRLPGRGIRIDQWLARPNHQDPGRMRRRPAWRSCRINDEAAKPSSLVKVAITWRQKVNQRQRIASSPR